MIVYKVEEVAQDERKAMEAVVEYVVNERLMEERSVIDTECFQQDSDVLAVF